MAIKNKGPIYFGQLYPETAFHAVEKLLEKYQEEYETALRMHNIT